MFLAANIVNIELANDSLYIHISVVNQFSDNKTKSNVLEKKSMEISRILRHNYYNNVRDKLKIWESPQVGVIGQDGLPTDSLGPFPEFILPSLPCKKTLQGFCNPCFFSKVSDPSKDYFESRESLLKQTQFIVDNFDEYISVFQTREHPIMKTQWDATICYACNGSFFSNFETTREIRFLCINMLYNEVVKRGLNIKLYIETCVDDYLTMLDSDEFQELLPLLLRLNTVVIFGFESHSDITRNLLYTKGLNIKDFEYAVAKSKEYNIFSGAFIYSGFHSLAEREILVDVIKTVMYLKDLGVMPVIMLPNVREYTLVDLLYKSNRYKLIDPITALEITRITCWITADLIADHAKFDPWLMGDPLGGPPPVKNGVFTNPQRICCDECTSRIMNALQHTRKIQNPLQLYTTVDTVQNCQNHCYDKYQQFILSEVTLKSKQSIQRRVEANLTYASAHIDEYLNMMRCEVE